jgi:hypothetical protein
MVKVIFLLAILIVTYIPVKSQKLSEQIFELGGNKKDCKIFGECDCCTSEIYFINDNQFALFDYCTFEHVLTIGTYKIHQGDLTLLFKQVSVTNGTEESGISPGKEPKKYLSLEKGEIKPLTFTFGKCEDGKIMLENKLYNDYKYGLKSNESGEYSRIASFLISEEWELINR